MVLFILDSHSKNLFELIQFCTPRSKMFLKALRRTASIYTSALLLNEFLLQNIHCYITLRIIIYQHWLLNFGGDGVLDCLVVNYSLLKISYCLGQILVLAVCRGVTNRTMSHHRLRAGNNGVCSCRRCVEMVPFRSRYSHLTTETLLRQ